MPALLPGVIGPGETELVNVVSVDLVERGKPLLIVSASVGQPLTRFVIGRRDPRAIHLAGSTVLCGALG